VIRPISRFPACCQCYNHPGVINTVLLDRGKLVTLIAGSNKRRSLLMAADRQRSVHDKKPQRHAKDNWCMQW